MTRVIGGADRLLGYSEKAGVELAVIVFIEIDTGGIAARREVAYVNGFDRTVADRVGEPMHDGFRFILRKATRRVEQKVCHPAMGAGGKPNLEQ